MRTLRWLVLAVLVLWVGAVVMTAGAPSSSGQQVQAQGKGKPGGGPGRGEDPVVGVEMIFHDLADFGNDGNFDDPVNLLSDGMERTSSGLVIASSPNVRYADNRLDLGDPYVSNTGNDGGLDFDDPNGESAAHPADARTFRMVFDDACVCETLLALPPGTASCTFTADYSDPLRNPRISTSAFSGKKADISIKFKLSGPNGNQWQVDSKRANLSVSGVGDQRRVTATSQDFELNRVGGGQFTAGTLCSGFTLPLQITFHRREVPQ